MKFHNALVAFLFFGVFTPSVVRLNADTYSWLGNQSADWHDGMNWAQPPCTGLCGTFPPGPNDDAIVRPISFVRPAGFSDNVSIRSLLIEDGATVSTNGYDLNLDDGLQGQTKLRINGTDSTLNVNGDGVGTDVIANRFELTGGATMRMDRAYTEFTANDSQVEASSRIAGNGEIAFTNTNGFTDVALDILGTVSVTGGDMIIRTVPSLTLGLFGRIDVDLDPNTLGGNRTLTIDAELVQPSRALVRIGRGDRLHMTKPWGLSVPIIAEGNILLNGLAGTATVSGADMEMLSSLSKISVTSGTGRIESNLKVTRGTVHVAEGTVLDLAGHAEFSADARINKAGVIDHRMIIRGLTTINQVQTFDWDGISEQHRTSILGGRLELNSSFIEGGQNRFDGFIDIIGDSTSPAGLQVATSWNMNGEMLLDGTHHLATYEGNRTTVSGRITIRGAETAIAAKLVVNSGILHFEPGSQLRLLDEADFSVLSNVSGSGEMVNEGILRTQTGTDLFVRLVNNGELRPGDYQDIADVGVLLTNEFRQNAEGKLQMIDLPSGPTDLLDVAGMAELDGTLHVDFQTIPSRGYESVLLTANRVTGEFANVIPPQVNPQDAWRVIYEKDQVFVRVTASSDLNSDGLLDCHDVDSLVSAIIDGNVVSDFDLNGDGLLDHDDLAVWLADAGAANLASGESYLLGDANLDGSVDVSDFNLWNANKFTSVAAYCSGDFNTDGVIDTSDFNIWNGNKLRSADDIGTVPEPAGTAALLFGLAACILARRESRTIPTEAVVDRASMV